MVWQIALGMYTLPLNDNLFDKLLRFTFFCIPNVLQLMVLIFAWHLLCYIHSPETFNAKKHASLESPILIMIVSWFAFLSCFFIAALLQLMVDWWFGLVVWIPRIPLWKGLLLRGIPRIMKESQTHQPTSPINHQLIAGLSLVTTTNNDRGPPTPFYPQDSQETQRSQQTRDSLRQLGAKKDLLNLDSYLLDRRACGMGTWWCPTRRCVKRGWIVKYSRYIWLIMIY